MPILLLIGGIIAAIAVLTIIAYLTVDFLKSFRKKANSEIVTASMKEVVKAARNSGTTMSFDELEMLEEKADEAEYITAEYDPQTDDVIQIIGAETADSRIETSINRSRNGVLVIS